MRSALVLVLLLVLPRFAAADTSSSVRERIKAANVAFRNGDFEAAQKELTEARAEAGENRAALSDVENALGGLVTQRGDIEAALEHYDRALELQRAVSGERSPEYAAILNNIGFAKMSSGRFGEAESSFNSARDIWEKTTPPTDDRRALVLSNLGELAYRTQRLNLAKTYFSKALDIRRNVKVQTPQLVALSYHNLAFVMSALGAYQEAIPLYEKALMLSERELGKNDPRVATALHNLAEAYSENGNEEKAEKLLRRALEIREASNAPETEVSLLALAELYAQTNRPALARPLAEKALAMVEGRSGDAGEVGQILERLAVIALATDDAAAAEKYYRRAAELAPESPPLLANLGFTLLKQKKTEEACSAYGKALSLHEQTDGDGLALVKPLRDLARCEIARGNSRRAIELLSRAEKTQSAASSAPPELVEILIESAAAHSLAGEQPLADGVLLRAKNLAADIYGAGSEDVRSIDERYRVLLQSGGASHEASSELNRAR